MHTKRMIPCLDVHGGRVVKGVNFVNLRDAGDPVEIAAAYDRAGADALVSLLSSVSIEAQSSTVPLSAGTSDRFGQFAKASLPIAVLSSQTIADVNAVHPSKAWLPIERTPLGMLTSSMPEQPANA